MNPVDEKITIKKLKAGDNVQKQDIDFFKKYTVKFTNQAD